MRRFLTISALLGLLYLLNLPTTAQEKTEFPPMAAFGTDGNLRLYGFDSEPIQITFQDQGLDKIIWHPGGPLHDLVWSSDGKYLAFVALDGHLALFDVETRKLSDLDAYAVKELQIAFDRSSQHILYGSVGDFIYETDYEDFYELNISRIAAKGDFTPETILSVGSESGVYGGGPMSPARWIYQTEMKGYWRFGDRTLSDTPFGILSFNGFGAHPEQETQAVTPGINLYQANGDVGLGGQSLPNATVSPDQKYIALIHADGIETIDLQILEHHFYKTLQSPNMVAWSGDEQIFYTSIEPVHDLESQMSQEDKNALLAYNQYTLDFDPLTSNHSLIQELNLLDGSERNIYDSAVYAIGQLMIAPDGKNLFFSTIPNLDMWWEKMLDRARKKDTSDFDAFELFQPSLYHMSLESGNLELIWTGLYKAAINFPAYFEQLQDK